MHVLVLNRRPLGVDPYDDWLSAHQVTVLTPASMVGPDARGAGDVVTVERYGELAEIIAVASRIHAANPFDRVIALGEFDIERAAAVRAKLGIRGQKPASAALFRDKLVMKTAMHAAGIPTPRFEAVGDISDVRRFVTRFGPALLKVRRGAGSRNIFYVDDNSPVPPLSDFAWENLANLYMIEAFIPHALHHVDGLITNGRLRVFSSATYVNKPLDFRDGVDGGSVLNDSDSTLHTQLLAFFKRLKRSLPFPNHTTFHIDIFSDGQGGFLAGEAACRTAGNRIREMIRLGYGVDLDRELVAAVVEERPERENAPRPQLASVGWGAIRKWRGRVEQAPASAPFPWLIDPVLHVPVGQDMEAALSAIDNAWSFMATGASQSDVLQNIDAGINWGRTKLASFTRPEVGVA